MNQRPNTVNSQASNIFFVTEKLLSPSTLKSSSNSTITPINTNRKSLKIFPIPLMPTRKTSFVTPISTDRSTKAATSQRTHRILRPPSLQPQDGIDNINVENNIDISRPGSPPKSLGSMLNMLDKSPSSRSSPFSGFSNTRSTWRPGSPSKSLLRASSTSRMFTRTFSNGFKNSSRGSSPEMKRKETRVDKAITKIQDIIEGCDKLQEEYIGLEKSLQDIEVEQEENNPKGHKENGKQMLKFDFWKNDERFCETRAKLRNEMEKIREEEIKRQKLVQFVESKGGLENMNKKKNKKEDISIRAEDLIEPSPIIKFILQKPRSFCIKRTPSSARKAERLFMATPLPGQGENTLGSPSEISIEKSLTRKKERSATMSINDVKGISFNIRPRRTERPDSMSTSVRENYNVSRNSRRENFKAEEEDRSISPVPYKSIASMNENQVKEIKGGFGDLFTRDRSKSHEKPVVLKRTPSMMLNETVLKIQKILDTPKVTNDDLFIVHKRGHLRSVSIQKMYRSSSMKDHF